MKIAQVGAFAATVASLSTFTYGYSFDDVPTTETETESTGLTANEENRIWGGSDGNIDKYPFLAGLRDSFFDETFCAGTLIAPQYILTAGHCIRTNEMQIIATFGTNDSTGSGSDGSDNKVGTMGTVLGWGKTQTSGESTSPTLQQITLPVISNAECGKFKKYVGRVTEGMLCAGTGNNKDTCNGDSGGPLLVDDDILIGCVSWGSKCGQQAGIFTRLTYVMDYIEDILAGGDGSKFKGSSSGSMDGVILPPSSDSSSSDDLMSILQGSGSNDLSWLLDLLKSNSGSGSNDLSWLFDSNSDSDSASGSEDTKGGKATKAPIEESSESAESDSGSEDAVLVKGGKTSKKTKSSKTLVEEDSDSASEDSAIQSDSVHQSDQVTQQSFK
ncbi:Plasminogen [Phytophthora nicotianae]|uniref:Plasminogen n=1 Tax=Phytophthora nicotianae TaxID=4792 RepID=A0A0W8CLK0_PHYNI|nr:Plasminogen [Phytophthora nicotianae]